MFWFTGSASQGLAVKQKQSSHDYIYPVTANTNLLSQSSLLQWTQKPKAGNNATPLACIVL